jgi:hypothetical protein
MSPVITNTNLVPINQVKDIIEKYNIDDVVELGDKALISTEEIKNINLNNNMLNISLPIAIAITAYSRIAIHKWKLLAGDGLLYSDTDSVYTTTPLPDHLVSDKGLGKMKLEHKDDNSIAKAVFLGPKVYSLLLEDQSVICKIKGSKVSVPFELMEELLKYNSKLIIEQSKMHKSMSNGNISIKDTLYTPASFINIIKGAVLCSKYILRAEPNLNYGGVKLKANRTNL